jgi:hypothetical protein
MSRKTFANKNLSGTFFRAGGKVRGSQVNDAVKPKPWPHQANPGDPMVRKNCNADLTKQNLLFSNKQINKQTSNIWTIYRLSYHLE